MNNFERQTLNPYPFPVDVQLKPWCYQILIIIFFFIIVIFPLTYYLGKKSNFNNKIRDWFPFTIGMILIVGEIYKQILYHYHYNFDGYRWEIFPFQLCSVPMYFSTMIPFFIKNDKGRDSLFSFMALYGMLGGFMVMINQNSVLTWEDYSLDYHSIIWHMLLITLGMFSFLALNIPHKNYKEHLKKFKQGTIVFIGSLILAEFLNLFIILNHGYNEYTQYGNLFYISMFIYNLSVPVLSFVTSYFGWYLGFVGYAAVLMFACYLITTFYFGVTLLIDKCIYRYKLYMENKENNIKSK